MKYKCKKCGSDFEAEPRNDSPVCDQCGTTYDINTELKPGEEKNDDTKAIETSVPKSEPNKKTEEQTIKEETTGNNAKTKITENTEEPNSSEQTTGNTKTEEKPDNDAPNPKMVDEEHIIRYYLQKKKIISFIGFENSGKSFFINRLRHDLEEKFEWNCRPKSIQKIPKTAYKIEETRVEPFINNKNKNEYVLLDCSGEELRGSYSAHTDDPRAKGKIELSSRYLSILGFASAYIFLIPSDYLVNSAGLNTEEKEKLRILIDSFYDFVNIITFLSEYLKSKKSLEADFKKLLDNGITYEQVDKNKNKRTKCKKPLIALFSKSDKYYKTVNNEDFDADPFMLAYKKKKFRKLFNIISSKFTNFRFDFLSSFWGHDDSFEPDYETDSYGAVQSFFWICDMLNKKSSRFSSLWSIRLRKIFDPEFREITKKEA